MVVDRKEEFNSAENYYGEAFPHMKGKKKIVSDQWKSICSIKSDREFLDAVKIMKDGWKSEKLRSARLMKGNFFGKIKTPTQPPRWQPFQQHPSQLMI